MPGLPIAPPGSGATPPPGTSVPVLQWMLDGITQTFGTKNVQGQIVEYGDDLGMPWGQPIGSPVAGRIVAINSDYANTSIGYIVQIQTWNGLWHIQHLMAPQPGLAVGNNVSVGDVIGYSGGCVSYGADPSTCATTDQYSTGPHIEVRLANSYNPQAGLWNQVWVDPLSQIESLGKGYANLPVSGNTQPTASPGNIPGLPGWQNNPGNPNPTGDCAAAYAAAVSELNVSENYNAADPRNAAKLAQLTQLNLQYLFCMAQASIRGWGARIGLFALGALLLGFGFLLLVHPDEEGALKAALAATKDGAVDA